MRNTVLSASAIVNSNASRCVVETTASPAGRISNSCGPTPQSKTTRRFSSPATPKTRSSTPRNSPFTYCSPLRIPRAASASKKADGIATNTCGRGAICRATPPSVRISTSLPRSTTPEPPVSVPAAIVIVSPVALDETPGVGSSSVDIVRPSSRMKSPVRLMSVIDSSTGVVELL